MLVSLVGSEAACIVVSLVRFGAPPATHSIGAKVYGLCLFAGALGLLTFDAPAWTVAAFAAVGLAANLEILAILFLSRTAPVDVPSIFALLKGKWFAHPPASRTALDDRRAAGRSTMAMSPHAVSPSNKLE